MLLKAVALFLWVGFFQLSYQSPSSYLACVPGRYGRNCDGVCSCQQGCVCSDGINGDGSCNCFKEVIDSPIGATEVFAHGSVNTSAGRTLETLQFTNTFIQQLPGDPIVDNYVRQVPDAFYSFVRPTPFRSGVYPIAFNVEVAALIDLDPRQADRPDFAEVFSGAKLMPGSRPFAQRYAGHQFGNFAGQLGDGRAVALGEITNSAGEHWELQLKGAGKTPYARHADGRAVLRSSVREFLCSEAMFRLGIPTSRALSLVGSDDVTFRDMLYNGNGKNEPSAIIARLAPSWVRFGTFEIFYYKNEHHHLPTLADYVIRHDFAHLLALPNKYAQFFREVVRRTAELIARWQAVGFAHGVLNTDNMSILGITIDYGPFGFLDSYDPKFVPNYSDDEGRYAFGKQPEIGLWNLEKLSVALSPILPSADAKSALKLFWPTFRAKYLELMCAKLGLKSTCGSRAQSLIDDKLLPLLQRSRADYPTFFRRLAGTQKMGAPRESLANMFPGKNRTTFDQFYGAYQQLLLEEPESDQSRKAAMNAVNPVYVLRNWVAQVAIENATAKDYSQIHVLQRLLSTPFSRVAEASARFDYSAPPPDWARKLLVSCSS